MGSMFNGCTSLSSLDVSDWGISKVTDMGGMFCNCTSLTTLNLSNWDTSGLFIPDMETEFMFSGCNSLHTLRLDNCSNDTISKIIKSSGFPTYAITGVTRTIYCKESEATGLTPPTNWVFSYVEEPPALYVPGEFQYNMEVTEVRTMVDESHNDLSNMFNFCMNLVSVNTEDWDTSNVTTMRNMFYKCTKLTSLDLSNWKTIQVADEDNMWWMFYGCSSLEFLDLSNWDLTYSANLHYAFHGCDKLHTIKLDNCSLPTIEIIIRSSGFTTNAIEGITRTIYVDKSLVITDGKIVDGGLKVYPPTNWVFEHMPE
jgi:surface protein